MSAEQTVAQRIVDPRPEYIPVPQRPRTPALVEVMAYRNDDVVDRYVVDNDADPARAHEVFADMLRWLWLCGEAKRESSEGRDVVTPTIFDEQLELDEMWHTFILFTPEYVDFCFKHFGGYLHHLPTPEREKREYLASTPEQRRAGFAEKQALRLRVAAYVFDKLGEEVARRWYLTPLQRSAAPTRERST